MQHELINTHLHATTYYDTLPGFLAELHLATAVLEHLLVNGICESMVVNVELGDAALVRLRPDVIVLSDTLRPQVEAAEYRYSRWGPPLLIATEPSDPDEDASDEEWRRFERKDDRLIRLNPAALCSPDVRLVRQSTDVEEVHFASSELLAKHSTFFQGLFDRELAKSSVPLTILFGGRDEDGGRDEEFLDELSDVASSSSECSLEEELEDERMLCIVSLVTTRCGMAATQFRAELPGSTS